jgi:NADH-quinone oxidoreductase subunit L
MTVALGVSAYSAAIFHLMTHAFFKALLFLGAGSVIIALHHEQDLRKMGGLRKYMPVTYWTAVVGTLALAGIPPFAGFFSKDAIIEAVHFSKIPGQGYAYFAVMTGVFVTAFYSFRMLFLAFHGKERFGASDYAHDDAPAAGATGAEHAHEASQDAGDEPGAHDHAGGPPKESPWVVTVPLVLLAIPSVYAGWQYMEPMLFGGFFGDSIVVRPGHAVLAELKQEWHGVTAFIRHGVLSLPFWLAIAGIVSAWYCYLVNPALPERLKNAAGLLYTLLDNKYYFDRFNDWFFAGGARRFGAFLSNVGDRTIIDGFFVNGTARVIGWTSALLRQLQSGYVYHYAFTMIIGLFALLSWWTLR